MASEVAIAKAAMMLHALYGPDKFPSPSPVMLEVWLDFFESVSDEQLLAAVKGWEDDWPPSAPALRRAARGFGAEREFLAPYHRPFEPDNVVALPAGERSDAIAAVRQAMRQRQRELDW